MHSTSRSRATEQDSLRLADRLLVLTLALAEAASRPDHAEMTALFAERQCVLSQLEYVPLSETVQELLRKVQLAEFEAVRRLSEAKAQVVRDLEKGRDGQRVAGAYRSGGAARSFDTFR
jgi:hypothetical protein